MEVVRRGIPTDMALGLALGVAHAGKCVCTQLSETECQRQRKARAELDDRLPCDIGVTDQRTNRQAARPSWYASKQAPTRPSQFSPEEEVMHDRKSNVIPFDLTRTFKRPMDVVEADDIDLAEKLAILKAWEADERALQRAEDEGMGGGEHAHLHKVREALTHLGDAAR